MDRLLGPTVFRGKFGQILRDTLQNSAAYCGAIVQILRCRGPRFMCLLSSILLRNFSYWKAGIVLSYASNIQRKLRVCWFFFLSEVQSLESHCLFTIVPYCDGY